MKDELCYLAADAACPGERCAMRTGSGFGAGVGDCRLTPALGAIYRMVEARKSRGVGALHEMVKGMDREELDATLTAAVCELTVALGLLDPDDLPPAAESRGGH